MTIEQPREWTRQEICDKLLAHARMLAKYWATIPLGPEHGNVDTEYRIMGAYHSLLATLDGCSPGIPGFMLIPLPHPDDKAYAIENGENWFPYVNLDELNVCDIGGALHDRLHPK